MPQRNWLLRSVVVLVMVVLGIACAGREATPMPTPAAGPTSIPLAREAGAPLALVDGKPVKEFFTDLCGDCHGRNREGGMGPALIPTRLTAEDEFYVKTIKDGRLGTAMPAWGQMGISDEEIRALVAFMRSQP